MYYVLQVEDTNSVAHKKGQKTSETYEPKALNRLTVRVCVPACVYVCVCV